MNQARNYKGKDVEMLITASTIIDAAIANKTFLQSKRSIWTDAFFTELKTAIDTTVQENLGKDSAKELRQATTQVLAIQGPALKDLAEVKVQIEADFNNEPAQKKEILNTLGFTTYYAKTKNKDQESLINLLYQYKTNLTPTLKAEIIAKGTAAAQLDTITAYADQLRATNVLQEGKKGTKKEITQESINAFNDIYNQVISIAKISAKFFKDKPEIQEQFSYTKVKNKLNNTKPKTDPKP